jgi:hypothetical protein
MHVYSRRSIVVKGSPISARTSRVRRTRLLTVTQSRVFVDNARTISLRSGRDVAAFDSGSRAGQRGEVPSHGSAPETAGSSGPLADHTSSLDQTSILGGHLENPDSIAPVTFTLATALD